MTVRVLQGHVLDVLASEPAGTYHCAVSSPPYLWARSYGTPPQTWPEGWRGELGQEPTPELFVVHLVAVMAAVGRVLRDDGTLWVNLAGSSYSDPGGQNGVTGNLSAKATAANTGAGRQRRAKHPFLKPLDWVDTPGLFARAMQEAGWNWRSDITWIKDSPMPENVDGTHWARCRVKVGKGAKDALSGALANAHRGSSGAQGQRGHGGESGQAEWEPCPGCAKCQRHGGYVLKRHNGRPTKATERILLFTKKSGAYYDAEGVRESNTVGTIARLASGPVMAISKGQKNQASRQDGGTPEYAQPAGRNLWNWWRIKGENLKEEHYAAYPSGLPAKCIAAGSSERGCCPACGAPWARVLEQRTLERYELPPEHPHYRPGRYTNHGQVDPVNGGGQRVSENTTLDWRPICDCPEQAPVPCRVLDPFGGSWTTAIAADRLGRDCTLVELNPKYAGMAERRVTKDAPLLMWGAVRVEGATG
jgi:DNA modification methylase